MTAIRLATHGELKALSLLMYESFFDDPAWGYVLPTVQLRSQWLARLMYAALEVAMDNGLVWSIAHEGCAAPAGVAIWYPAVKPFPPPWYRVLVPALRISDFSLFHLPSALRYSRLERRMLQLRPASVKRCWYLAGLAVANIHRGSGMGSMLVREALARATTDRSPVYLQAWDRLVPFYERLGFAAVSHFSLANGSTSCHGMLWQPPAMA